MTQIILFSALTDTTLCMQLEIMIRDYQKQVFECWVHLSAAEIRLIAAFKYCVSQGCKSSLWHSVLNIDDLCSFCQLELALSVSLVTGICKAAQIMLQNMLRAALSQSWENDVVNSDCLLSVSKMHFTLSEDSHIREHDVAVIVIFSSDKILTETELLELMNTMFTDFDLLILSDATQEWREVAKTEVSLMHSQSCCMSNEAINVWQSLNLCDWLLMWW